MRPLTIRRRVDSLSILPMSEVEELRIGKSFVRGDLLALQFQIQLDAARIEHRRQISPAASISRKRGLDALSRQRQQCFVEARSTCMSPLPLGLHRLRL